MTGDMRILVKGMGSIGRRHLTTLRQIDKNLELVSVTQRDPTSFPESSLASIVVSDLSEINLSDFDGIILAGPASGHVSDAHFCLTSNAVIFIEKPLGLSLNKVQNLTNAALTRRSFVLVGYVLRYNAVIEYLKEQIERNILGDLVFADVRSTSYLPLWRKDTNYRVSVSAIKSLGGGVLNELSHEIDLCNWLFGFPAVVEADLFHTGQLQIESAVEDVASVRFRTPNGLRVNVYLDFANQCRERKILVHGTQGHIVADVLSGVVLKNVNEEKSVIDLNHTTDMYVKQMIHFLDVCKGNAQPKVTLADGVDVVEIIERIRESSGFSSGRFP